MVADRIHGTEIKLQAVLIAITSKQTMTRTDNNAFILFIFTSSSPFFYKFIELKTSQFYISKSIKYFGIKPLNQIVLPGYVLSLIL
jgi:hypothetical protein